MTTTSRARTTGSASRWGALWGARPKDWAITEDQQTPTYEDALRFVGLESGQRVLDIGCGVGAFLSLVVDRGGKAHGIDASEALVARARTRLPDADLRVGEMEELPWDDDTFDLVTGFNAFFFADDMVAALREAGRVAKPGAAVVIQVWGAHERCQLEAMKEVARPFLPPRPPDAPPDPDLSQPGALETLAIRAGLTPESEFDTTWAYVYPDEDTLGRALLAPAGLAVLAGPEREDAVKAAIVDGLAAYRTETGSYRLENEFHTLIARAWRGERQRSSVRRTETEGEATSSPPGSARDAKSLGPEGPLA
jgi:SAM-dependent methyltransferase